jgi:anti-sigma factor RsiW
MKDVTERLSTKEMAELCALADGTLAAERRAEVEARVAASPELQELLERQRRAVLAAQTLAAEEVPGRAPAQRGGLNGQPASFSSSARGAWPIRTQVWPSRRQVTASMPSSRSVR